MGDDEDENYEYDFLLPDESTEAERLEHRSRLKRLQEEKLVIPLRCLLPLTYVVMYLSPLYYFILSIVLYTLSTFTT